jgi:hypothetical protein
MVHDRLAPLLPGCTTRRMPVTGDDIGEQMFAVPGALPTRTL